MKKINWKQIAKDNNMSYYDFCEEVMHLAVAHMDLECARNDSDIMELNVKDFGTLTYTKEKNNEKN